jgi:O-antigen/teichoic acid export membrane protein
VTTSRVSASRLVATARAAPWRLLRDPSSLLVVCQLIGAGVAFVANILAARELEPSGRGELALLLQIAYLSSLGLLLGSDRSVIAVYSGSPARIVTRSFARLLVAPSAVGLVAVALALALPLHGVQSWRGGLALALLFAVINAFVRAVRSIAIAAGRYREYLGYCLASGTLMLLAIGVLVVVDSRNSTVWMLAYLVVGTLPTAVWLGRWAWSVPPANAAQSSAVRGALRVSRREGLQLFPSALAQSGMLRLDRLLLAGLASTAELGMYATVATMTELIGWPLLAFADSRLGRWRAAHDGGTLALRGILVTVVGYSVAAACLMAVTLHLLLVPLLGISYQPAGQLVVPLVAAAAVLGVSQILVSLLIAVRQNSLASVVEIAGFAVSIVGYVALISQHGALGAAVGSLLGYLACLAGAALALMRVRNLPRRSLDGPAHNHERGP